MATEETRKVEAQAPPAPPPPPPPAAEAPAEVVQEKAGVPHAPLPEQKADDSRLLWWPTIPDPPAKKTSSGSLDRDIALAQVETEKRLSFIKAWEDSEKTKVENKSQKKLSAVASWENSKKAAIEANLKKLEEELEKKKADYAEKMKNRIAEIHKLAEEKRAMVEAKKGEEMLKAEEMAAKYRATGHVPKKLIGCLGC
ncbi:hypothetical protein NMG60_11022903 [Bertholletia excelsa]